MTIPDKTRAKITQLYGADNTAQIAEQIESLLKRYSSMEIPEVSEFLTERDCLLITYADSLQESGRPPLQTLSNFCRDHLKNLISAVHLLPFFPYSSDDGFSVIDYRQVNPTHGDWFDLVLLAENFDLCFDLVLNHVSAASEYFQGFLAGDPKYRDFFIELPAETDTSRVLRPRTAPLLQNYPSADGQKYCWATFSKDQLDFNYANPNMLLEMLDILFFYIAKGARILRLDAIAYLWKQLGTSCAHLPQTHLVVQLFRDLLDLAAPHVLLLTETNVPHEDNISYFGDGSNEAQIVYNFSLPPLVLYSLTVGSAKYLNQWAKDLAPPSPRTTFLNFTASHDGIGLRPAADILPEREFQKIVGLAKKHGGAVSCKNDSQGKPIPYELNLNYFDALNNPNEPAAELQTQIDRFLLSQSIALTLVGMPAIYIHSLLGSVGWPAGVEKTGQPRTINRENSTWIFFGSYLLILLRAERGFFKVIADYSNCAANKRPCIRRLVKKSCH